MANVVVVGKISNSNPSLWLDLSTIGSRRVEYLVETLSPGVGWIYINQFCSLLSTEWLNTNEHPGVYGIQDFSSNEIISMGEELIALESLDAQVNAAVASLPGVQTKLDTAVEGVLTKYNVGTKVWLGNDVHVYGLLILDGGKYSLYDSNTGLVSTELRSDFKSLVVRLSLNTFVVSEV
ncbi:hypothetical protein [Agaribacterium sp. ZY112]|uniref:hypothetical protein n=1 Tax=Agaribacterium sp. ZY112 TaxID=3233574 RepID=UPI0035240A12